MRISDARRVRQRVESHASQLHLRGARKHVFRAVLWLLCDHKRITDDRVHLHQIMWFIYDNCGHRYDLKTIGRALSSLTGDQLITYQSAQGRGNCAIIAIHPQFTGDVEILKRDSAGKVIVEGESVTFSRPRHSPIGTSNNHPTFRNDRTRPEAPDTRPIEVPVDPKEVREVRESLPAVYQTLPTPQLRWRLGGIIRRQLARGYRPDQILEVLAAPMPADVKYPYRFARNRLLKNMIGAGPRLAPLQVAWDRAQDQTEAQTYETAVQQDFAQIATCCDDELRTEVLHAAELRFGPSGDPRCALIAASRFVRRHFPDLALSDALRQWSAQARTTAHPPPPAAPDIAGFARPGAADTCVSCLAAPGISRPSLPIPELRVVCDDCWNRLADPELQEEAA